MSGLGHGCLRRCAVCAFSECNPLAVPDLWLAVKQETGGCADQGGEKMAEPQTNLPKELHIDAKWDRFIDLTVRRTVYGTLAGGVAAVLLARAPSPAPDALRRVYITFYS